MKKYALVGPGDAIVRIEASIDPNTGTKSGYRWLPYVETPEPDYDWNTHKLLAYVDTVFGDRVERVWTTASKTQAERDADLDEMREKQLNRLGRICFEALFELVNDVRVLKGQTAITKTQYRNHLKSLDPGS